MNKNTRIKLTDDTRSAILKMVDGNPGAVGACMELLLQSEKIDPDVMMGGLGNILLLDSFGIYGTDIYVLYSDIYNRNIAKMCTVLRATQLGFFSQEKLFDISHRQDYSGRDMIDIPDLYKQVKERLPNFDPEHLVNF